MARWLRLKLRGKVLARMDENGKWHPAAGFWPEECADRFPMMKGPHYPDPMAPVAEKMRAELPASYEVELDKIERKPSYVKGRVY